MTRRALLRYLSALPACGLLAQNRPDSFKVYSESPRLLLRPQRLRLLRRERERRSLRWDQFETLWTANTPFPEPGWAQALRYRVADDRDAGTRAIAWAVGPADATRQEDVRQMAIIADWCAPVISGDDKNQLMAKLQRVAADSRPLKTLADARTRVFAAMALVDTQPAVSEKALQGFFDAFWSASLIAALRNAKSAVSNADAYAMLEILHVFRDNLNFDLRDTFPDWFKQYPLLHLLAHYPAPWPAAENEFRIPADETIEKTGPDVRKAALSRAAELAMVAYDANAASSQLLQGWLTNDRFLMRGAHGIPYEMLWANPYQPGLSYYHAPLALHDEIGGQLFVRSSWEDDASWAGFFGGQLQLFKDGSVTRMDPAIARDPLDLETAVVFFARESKRFQVAKRENDAAVFIVGLDAGHSYHVEVDGEEMTEEQADPGGIVFLPEVPPGGVRLGSAPAGL
ncbi:MAG TPA: hypothetical protein VK789_05525 [Bryobacteraceae bacterium]|jgi:hypothetical protein|nr:hypothetical protein [Bryobacteraceae bacterium]